MGLYLSEPVRDVHERSLEGDGGVEVGGAGVQGWRLVDEDSVALCHLHSGCTMAAVFDGHGGREVRVDGAKEVDGVDGATLPQAERTFTRLPARPHTS